MAYRVMDSNLPQQTAMQTFNISIGAATPALTITTTSLPNSMVGASYSASISASGGTPPYMWSQVTTIACPALAGVFCGLPPGLTVNLGAAATISGVPTKPGQYFVEFQLTDNSSPQQTATRVFTISIAAAAAFLAGQNSLGNGGYYLQFPNGNLFGYYNFPDYPILYHYDMGFEALIDGGNGNAYLYDFSSSHWFYTSSSLFPNLYDFTLNDWLYYFPDTKSPGHYTTNPRYFSNLATGQIFTM